MLKPYRVEVTVDYAESNKFCDQVISGACFVVGVGANDEPEAAGTAIEYLRTYYHELQGKVECVEDGAFTLAQCNVIAHSQHVLGKVRRKLEEVYDKLLNAETAIRMFDPSEILPMVHDAIEFIDTHMKEDESAIDK